MIRVHAAVVRNSKIVTVKTCKNVKLGRLAGIFVQPTFTYNYKKEGKSMEIADIRNQLNDMHEKINSFRGSL